ncbi:TadE/TadG family type IV pilus assembly protein [Sphingomonas sp. OK281]|uniref:TadE/TadG family type IV pilus assembly protein n=1 Tax=Sphingomonas sp. OK281 TaxID=1881067 RepID=UPI0008F35D57|nr:histidine kinase [Sphingomonas sp. OK281]SFN78439.1 Flp pilus assembly protein TadG [Sphingomonas sp. OK281]
MTRASSRLAAVLRRLRDDRSGLALLEFAFTAPLVVTLGLYGVETANLAITNLRVSQVALNLADNASRVGVQSSLVTQQLREIDVNDTFAAVKTQGQAWDLTTRGRITLSSLEADTTGKQTIHWQRCLGLKSGVGYDSGYGRTTIVAGIPSTAENSAAAYDPAAGVNTSTTGVDNAALHPGSVIVGGMGDTGAKIVAPNNSGVMFVEVNYDYKPVVSSGWLPNGAAKIRYIASFIVRDRRDFGEIYNPSPVATRMTCDKYTS